MDVAFSLLKVKVLVVQVCWTLFEPMECSPPGHSVHGILQARILQSVAMPFSRGSCWPRGRIWVFCTAGRFLPPEAPRKPLSNDSPSLLFCRANSLLFNFIAIVILLLDLCDSQDAALFYFCDNCQTINVKLKEKNKETNNNLLPF